MEDSTLQERSDRIAWLLDEAREQGYLTLGAILEAFPEAEDDLDQLDDLVALLYDQGVEIRDPQEDSEEFSDQVEGEAVGEAARVDAPDLSRIPADDTVSLYFREMSHVPLLTVEEEVNLTRRIERGREARRELARNGHDAQERSRLQRLIERGQEARAHLIKANTRLVVSVAKKYRGHGLPFLDLIQAGNVGLIKAADKFDYRLGNKFCTYATWWIRQAITRSIADQARTIRIPVHMIETINKLNRISRQMLQQFGREATPEELAKEMEMPEDKIRKVLKIAKEPISMETPIGDDEDSHLGDFIEDGNASSPVDSATETGLMETVRDVLAGLTPREAKVLRMRFGIDMNTDHTLEEVGKQFDVTRERIRQIEAKALRKLRHPSRSEQLRSFLDVE